MSYNKHNTRNSVSRYNNGQFVSAGVLAGDSAQQSAGYTQQTPQSTYNTNINAERVNAPLPPVPPLPKDNSESLKTDDVVMTEQNPTSEESKPGDDPRPLWMKVKKISNKERRRRQNEHLRRLLTPKNAVMVLNEMLPNEQISNNFKTDPVLPTQFYNKNGSLQQGFCSTITLDGVVYTGYGDNKMGSRNAAAELAFRDIVIKKMIRASTVDYSEGTENEETVPMIQIASFALHKLFSGWESEGHKVPLMRPPPNIPSEGGDEQMDSLEMSGSKRAAKRAAAASKPKKPKILPENASTMHPCMLLTYMRPGLEYRDLAAEGERAQSMIFTVGLEIDGTTYIGKASNKREARKAAARAACLELFHVQFEENTTSEPAVVY